MLSKFLRNFVLNGGCLCYIIFLLFFSLDFEGDLMAYPYIFLIFFHRIFRGIYESVRNKLVWSYLLDVFSLVSLCSTLSLCIYWSVTSLKFKQHMEMYVLFKIPLRVIDLHPEAKHGYIWKWLCLGLMEFYLAFGTDWLVADPSFYLSFA